MRSLRLFLLVMAWGFPLMASAQTIRDDAGLYQPETLAEARANIAEIEKVHGKKVLVETYATLSKLRCEGYNIADAGHLHAIFTQWAQDRCRAENLDGLYILICKEPKYILVMPWPESNAALITDDNRVRIRRILASSLGFEVSKREWLRTMRVTPRKRPKADEGLLHALWVVDQKMEWHRPIDWSGWSGGMAGMIALLCGWMALGVVRNHLRKRAARGAINTPEQYNAPLGTPGAVLGGGMGAVVAQWLIDRWNHGARGAPLTVVDGTPPTFHNSAPPASHST